MSAYDLTRRPTASPYALVSASELWAARARAKRPSSPLSSAWLSSAAAGRSAKRVCRPRSHCHQASASTASTLAHSPCVICAHVSPSFPKSRCSSTARCGTTWTRSKSILMRTCGPVFVACRSSLSWRIASTRAAPTCLWDSVSSFALRAHFSNGQMVRQLLCSQCHIRLSHSRASVGARRGNGQREHCGGYESKKNRFEIHHCLAIWFAMECGISNEVIKSIADASVLCHNCHSKLHLQENRQQYAQIAWYLFGISVEYDSSKDDWRKDPEHPINRRSK